MSLSVRSRDVLSLEERDANQADTRPRNRHVDGRPPVDCTSFIRSRVRRSETFRLAEGSLFLGQTRLVAQSETVFVNRGLAIEFVCLPPNARPSSP